MVLIPGSQQAFEVFVTVSNAEAKMDSWHKRIAKMADWRQFYKSETFVQVMYTHTQKVMAFQVTNWLQEYLQLDFYIQAWQWHLEMPSSICP